VSTSLLPSRSISFEETSSPTPSTFSLLFRFSMATWPLTGKGQFDITKGDYHRTLDDVEFLNDTMIEYGLR